MVPVEGEVVAVEGKTLVLALAFPRTDSPSVSLSRSSTERDHTFHSAVVEFAIPASCIGVTSRTTILSSEVGS